MRVINISKCKNKFFFDFENSFENAKKSLNLPKQGDKFSPFLYDAVLLYALALKDTMLKKQNISNGVQIVKNLRDKFFRGYWKGFDW